MSYDYLTINFAAAAGILFMLIFLRANSSLDKKIKRIFYLLILVETIEVITYSLELWTTTFEHLSILRLILSAIGYSIRPVILCLILLLALRNTSERAFPKLLFVPQIINTVGAFSVFFTDIVYSYTPDNQFHRGPLGYCTHIVATFYLVCLIVIVFRDYKGRPKFETVIIFALCLLIMFSMVVEALYSVRTIGRTAIVLIIIFYYMFFQTQIYKATLNEEQSLRLMLEHANRLDGITGLLNKTAFADTAQSLLASSPDSSAAFIFLDLDHLKEVNDKLGHAMGDVTIIDASDTIQSIFRKTDLVGRFGGDEFCILLMDIPKSRFHECLEETKTRLRRTYSDRDLIVPVTASIGAVYAQRVQDLSYDTLMQLADEAVYEAKASGRDRYVLKEI